ncbi:unnamed protein product [Victoria cruziana]
METEPTKVCTFLIMDAATNLITDAASSLPQHAQSHLLQDWYMHVLVKSSLITDEALDCWVVSDLSSTYKDPFYMPDSILLRSTNL